jgi:hypothetical protein
MSWHLRCFVAGESVFPVNVYNAYEFDGIWQDIQNVFSNPNSGIATAVLSNYEWHKVRSFRKWVFHTLEEAQNKLAAYLLLK